MWLDLLGLSVGVGLLAWGANRFIKGTCGVAGSLGMPPLVIGVTLVGFATSVPEMLVSLVASLHGKGAIALGNALGSYMTNMGLVLGLTALVCPLKVHSALFKREFPLLFVAVGIVGGLMWDGQLSPLNGLILLGAFLITLVLVTKVAVASEKMSDELGQTYPLTTYHQLPLKQSMMGLIIGFGGMLISSRILTITASNIARALGVSDFVIGLTVVAVGTSLPELAASIVSALYGEMDIAVGNVIGSNLFGILVVTAMPAVFDPGRFDPLALKRDVPAMLAITALLCGLCLRFKKMKGGRRGGIAFPKDILLSRLSGGILLGSFVIYLLFCLRVF